MISAGSAVSDSRTAPSTDCSASRFCGGATGPSPFVYPLVSAGALIGRSSLGRRPDRTYVLRAWCGVNEEAPGNPALRRVVRRTGGRLLLLDDHRLDGRGDAVLDLDVDHAGADRADRLLEVDLAAVDRDPAGLLDRVGDVLRGDGREQAAVVARLVLDREHRAVEDRRGLLRALGGLGQGPGGDLAALLGRRDGALGGRRGQLAGDQI